MAKRQSAGRQAAGAGSGAAAQATAQGQSGKLQTFLQKCPWSILIAGAAIQILTGVPSAWGVFQRGVCEGYSLDTASASMIFSLTIGFFGVGCILGGLLQDKRGPRVAGLAGAVLLSAGFCAASIVPAGAPWLFYGAFSVPVGLGCAFLYPAVMSCAQKWYAGRKGLATGVIGGAVGASGAVLTVCGRFLIGRWGIRAAFCTLGIAMLLVCGAGAAILEDPEIPPDGGRTKTNDKNGRAAKAGKKDRKAAKSTQKRKDGQPAAAKSESEAGQTAGAAPQSRTGQTAGNIPKSGKKCAGKNESKNKGAQAEANNYTVREMLRTPQYWLLFAVVGLATPAVLLFSPVIVELAQERGLSETAALACIVVGSVFSAAGRLLMPWLSDKIGRRYTDMLLMAALCGLSVWFAFAAGWTVLLVYSLLTFCYSGEAAVIPAAGTDLFGAKHAGVNYGFLALGMSAGSVGFPLLARSMTNAAARHIIAACAPAAGFLCLCFLKPTHGERL